ncbi:MAG: DMT family transporter [Bacteroidales bacterium]
MSSTSKGIIYGIIAAIVYGLNPLFALPLYKDGMSPDSVLFYRYAFAAIILAIMLKTQKQSLALKKNEIIPLIIVGLLFSFSSLFLFQSFLYMEAGLACTILFVYPVMVAVIMFVFFHEKASWLTIFCVLLALSGIVLLYHGDGDETLSLTGMILVILSSLAYAIYIVGANQSSLRNMTTGKLTFYALLFGLSVYIIRLRFLTDLQPITSAGSWMDLLAMAIFPTIISLVCIASAIHRIGSTLTAVLGALEPVTALIIGVIVFHEKLTTRIMIGVVMVITAVTLVIMGNSIIQFTKKVSAQISARRRG